MTYDRADNLEHGFTGESQGDSLPLRPSILPYPYARMYDSTRESIYPRKGNIPLFECFQESALPFNCLTGQQSTPI